MRRHAVQKTKLVLLLRLIVRMGEPVISIRPLAPEKFRKAFALLEIAGCSLSLEQWLDYAQTATRETGDIPSGIMSAETEREYIYCIFNYLVSSQEEKQRILKSDFVVLPNYYATQLKKLLLATIDEIAEEFRCSEIIIDFARPFHKRKPSPTGELGSSLLASGYRLEEDTFSKHLNSV